METKQNKTGDQSVPSKEPYSTPQNPKEGKNPSIEKHTTETALGLNNYGPMTCNWKGEYK